MTHELRRELSERYLREGATITEVAFLLGYSEASAFHRSFKRWTGRTPRRSIARASGRPDHRCLLSPRAKIEAT